MERTKSKTAQLRLKVTLLLSMGFFSAFTQNNLTVHKSDNQDPSVTYEYVDLGLSVKWATFNVGASKPEEYGEYYSWAETETKSSYSWTTYKYCNGTSTSLTKYITNSSYGTVDNKITLEPDDDVAHVKWGGNWRMPTIDEISELRNTANCSWTFTTQNGVKGNLVTSKKSGYEGRSIFLPSAGFYDNAEVSSIGEFGGYWSSSLNVGAAVEHSDNAHGLFFGQDGRYAGNGSIRYYGFVVRPVCQ